MMEQWAGSVIGAEVAASVQRVPSSASPSIAGVCARPKP
jgi:hypothetical protein